MLGILMIGLESFMASNPQQSKTQVEKLSYSDWDRLKELFH